jgi:hypothetical protein
MRIWELILGGAVISSKSLQLRARPTLRSLNGSGIADRSKYQLAISCGRPAIAACSSLGRRHQRASASIAAAQNKRQRVKWGRKCGGGLGKRRQREETLPVESPHPPGVSLGDVTKHVKADSQPVTDVFAHAQCQGRRCHLVATSTLAACAIAAQAAPLRLPPPGIVYNLCVFAHVNSIEGRCIFASD